MILRVLFAVTAAFATAPGLNPLVGGATNAPLAFMDVPEDLRPAANFVSETGLMTGYDGDRFEPNWNLTRAEAAAILTRKATCNATPPFNDTPDGWQAEVLCRAYDAGVMTGYDDDTARPNVQVTVAEAMTMTARAVGAGGHNVPENCPYWWCSAAHFMWEIGAIPSGIETLNQPITRGQMAVMLHSLHKGVEASYAPDLTVLYPEPPMIIDSNLTLEEALSFIPDACPQAVKDRQKLLTVRYRGFAGELRQGQIMVDERLAPDVEGLFQLLLELEFPIEKAVLMHEYNWDDYASMDDNNTNAFAWRKATGLNWISHHGYGFAIDINPRQNPYYKGDITLPADGTYDVNAPGTLYSGHPAVQFMLARGWGWGGHWRSPDPLDYHHFQKLLY